MKKILLSSVFLLALGGVSVLVYDYVSKPTMSAIQTNKYMKKQSVSIREFDENTSLDLSNEKITSTDLVLYENGRGFVSQNRQVLLKKGLQEINFGKIPEGLILSSVSVSGKNIALQTINFDPHFDEKTYYEVAQEEAIGKEVTLLWTVWKEGVKSEIKQNATLLAVEQGTPILQIDGMIHKGTDARILYPALKSDVENKKRSLDFSVVSDTDKKQELTFSYLTNGFNWSTNYNLYLDEDKNEMTLKGS